jgi:hypothetical protein
VKKTKKYGCVCVKKTAAHNFKSYKSIDYNPAYTKQPPVVKPETRYRPQPTKKPVNVCKDDKKVYNAE